MKAAETILLAGALLLVADPGGFAQAEPPPISYHYYNYPHQLPYDYVYRTGRIFLAPTGRSPRAVRPPAAAPAIADGHALPLRISELAGQLLGNAEEEIADQYRLAVSTFVNLNNLYRTSALGRYVSEQLIGELQTAGVAVVELRRTPSIMVSQAHGEYALSREMNQLAFIHAVQATLVGTYTVAAEQLFVNARILRNRDNKVLASASLTLPFDGLIRSLLADEATPTGQGTPVKIRARYQDRDGA